MTKPDASLLKKCSTLSGDDPLDVAYPNGSGFDERDRIQEHRGKPKSPYTTRRGELSG